MSFIYKPDIRSNASIFEHVCLECCATPSSSRPYATLDTPALPFAQATCDDVQDAAGKPRFVVRGEHALYLDEEEAPSLFEEAGTLARFGDDSWMDSAEEVARKRDAAATAGGGWFSWLKW